MARVTFINAILSGKLAGTIYARNKAGYYIKQWSNPLDPKSTAQLENRARLTASAGAWHALDDIQKAIWNTFGATTFVPKFSISASPSSGFNAFVSLRTQAAAATQATRVATVTAPVGTTVTFEHFIPGMDAPAAAMSSNIQSASVLSLPINLGVSSFEAASQELITTFVLGAPSPGLPIFLDAATQLPVGIEFQISNPKTQVNNFVTGKNNQIVAVLAPPELVNAAFTGNIVTFKFSGADLDISRFKNFVQADQVVLLSAYLVSQNGQSRFIGSRKLTVI